MLIKSGDTVEVRTGNAKGTRAKVLNVLAAKRPDGGQRLVVEGVNRVYRHIKRSQKNPQGGRINVERPIHISNVLPVNPKSSHGSRVRYQLSADGSKKRLAADGTEIGTVRKAK